MCRDFALRLWLLGYVVLTLHNTLHLNGECTEVIAHRPSCVGVSQSCTVYVCGVN